MNGEQRKKMCFGKMKHLDSIVFTLTMGVRSQASLILDDFFLVRYLTLARASRLIYFAHTTLWNHTKTHNFTRIV